MRDIKNTTSGFWFAYVDSLTGLAVIFLILYVAAANRERIINGKHEQLVRSWELANDSLVSLGAAPVPDRQMGGMRITLTDSLIFPFGAAFLNSSGESKIVQISHVLVKFFKGNPAFENIMGVMVGGHTDKVGGDTINFPLSYRRANNVANIMKHIFKEEGLRVTVTPIAYGSKFPIPGLNGEVEPRNRRITIVIQLLSTELLTGSED